MSHTSDGFNRAWIMEQSVEVCEQYDPGVLTLRGLYYQLVSRGMTNTLRHYKRVVSAMGQARREGVIGYGQFSDHDREPVGSTDAEPTNLEDQIEDAKSAVMSWVNYYRKSRWENQPRYVELWIEKKALQGVFQTVSEFHHVALCPCKGYPSLTFLSEAAGRFARAGRRGQSPVIVYFGDHDPSGEDIPRAIGNSLLADFGVDVEVQVIGLTEEQCLDLQLPPAPVKSTDSRSANFDGLGQIEQEAETEEYRTALREFVATL